MRKASFSIEAARRPRNSVGIPGHSVASLATGFTARNGSRSLRDGPTSAAPELFRTVELVDPMRSKQLYRGLQELGEEGAIQVFRPVLGNAMLLGAIGQLRQIAAGCVAASDPCFSSLYVECATMGGHWGYSEFQTRAAVRRPKPSAINASTSALSDTPSVLALAVS